MVATASMGAGILHPLLSGSSGQGVKGARGQGVKGSRGQRVALDQRADVVGPACHPVARYNRQALIRFTKGSSRGDSYNDSPVLRFGRVQLYGALFGDHYLFLLGSKSLSQLNCWFAKKDFQI